MFVVVNAEVNKEEGLGSHRVLLIALYYAERSRLSNQIKCFIPNKI